MDKVVSLTWSSHGRDITSGIWKFFQEKFKADFEISINGSYVKAHHLILAIFCPVVKQTDNSTLILGESADITQRDVESLIEFLYRGQIDVNEDRLPALKVAAEEMGIGVLADIITKFIDDIKAKEVRKETHVKTKHSKTYPEFINIKKPTSEIAKLPSATLMLESHRARLATTVNSMGKTPCVVGELTADEESELVKSRTRRRASCRLGLSKDSFDPGSLQYKCKHCEAGFSKAVDFYNHVRTHENRDLRFQCKYCDYKSEHSTSVAHHMMARHQIDREGNRLEKDLKCPHCSYVCAANFRLKNHIYQVHEGKTKECDVCGYRCASHAVLAKHKNLVHSDVRPYICEVCGYRAKQFHSFRNHMRIHYRKKVSCDICGSSVSSNQLTTHKRIHMGITKPHACHHCSFTAWRKYSLKIHLKNVHKIEVDEDCGPDLDTEFLMNADDANIDLRMECVEELI